ncbi:MAG: LUD domain-containing protein [Verrucomicrobiaceae bacterium]|nr:LUD domain-containing protein [Verrucomicrobiaceae bacterium]
MTTITDDRSTVFTAIREVLAGRAEKAALPDWDASLVICNPPQAFDSLADHFRFKFEAAGGYVLVGWEALKSFLAEKQLKLGYCDPAFEAQVASTASTLSTSLDRSCIDDYEFGITRATAAIAETGSLILTESGSSSRLGALAPWYHIAILPVADIVPDMPTAIAHFGTERSSLFVTGPSKTADVEGILIKGVHGPGIQVCCLV